MIFGWTFQQFEQHGHVFSQITWLLDMLREKHTYLPVMLQMT